MLNANEFNVCFPVLFHPQNFYKKLNYQELSLNKLKVPVKITIFTVTHLFYINSIISNQEPCVTIWMFVEYVEKFETSVIKDTHLKSFKEIKFGKKQTIPYRFSLFRILYGTCYADKLLLLEEKNWMKGTIFFVTFAHK